MLKINHMAKSRRNFTLNALDRRCQLLGLSGSTENGNFESQN